MCRFTLPKNMHYHVFAVDLDTDEADFLFSTDKEAVALEIAQTLSETDSPLYNLEYRVRVPAAKAHTIFRFANGEPVKNEA